MTKPRLLAIVGAAVVLTAGAAYFYSHRAPAIEQIGMMGMPAPVWKLMDLNGHELNSEQFKGKVVVVDFWATWCGPCISEIPGYVALQKKYGKDGLVIVGVSLDRIGPERVKKFAQENGMDYTLVMGDDDMVEAFGGFEAIPTTFLINRSGRIVHQKTGAVSHDEYEKLVQRVLN
ncbi:MAG TPA: TlpA disulfide reductase family protein [Lacunisphaera sp.]|nr:TlpA disulfide reductase family protein [Lacunisphaera sp.]